MSHLVCKSRPVPQNSLDIGRSLPVRVGFERMREMSPLSLLVILEAYMRNHYSHTHTRISSNFSQLISREKLAFVKVESILFMETSLAKVKKVTGYVRYSCRY